MKYPLSGMRYIKQEQACVDSSPLLAILWPKDNFQAFFFSNKLVAHQHVISGFLFHEWKLPYFTAFKWAALKVQLLCYWWHKLCIFEAVYFINVQVQGQSRCLKSNVHLQSILRKYFHLFTIRPFANCHSMWVGRVEAWRLFVHKQGWSA